MSLTIPHLRGEVSDVVFVEQVSERADLHLKQIGGAGLIAGGLS